MKRGIECRIIKMAGTKLFKNRFSICITEGITLFSLKAHEKTQAMKQQAKQNTKSEWNRMACVWGGEIN